MPNGNDLYFEAFEVDDHQSPIRLDKSQADDFDLQLIQSFDPNELFSADVSNATIISSPQTVGGKADIERTDKEAPRYPLLGAYTQRCIELRQQLKSIKSTPALHATTLHALYRTAAVAELLHSKSSEGKLSLGQLKMLPDELINELDMPYDKLGYSELRLLRKSDIKQLVQLWGKPTMQQCPRSYHRQSWQEICQRFG